MLSKICSCALRKRIRIGVQRVERDKSTLSISPCKGLYILAAMQLVCVIFL